VTNKSSKAAKNLNVLISKLYGQVWGLTKSENGYYPTWLSLLPAGKSFEFVYVHSSSPAEVSVSGYTLIWDTLCLSVQVCSHTNNLEERGFINSLRLFLFSPWLDLIGTLWMKKNNVKGLGESSDGQRECSSSFSSSSYIGFLSTEIVAERWRVFSADFVTIGGFFLFLFGAGYYYTL